MKKVFILFILSLFVFSGCDYVGTFTFKIENATQETITLRFVNKSHSSSLANRLGDGNEEEVILLPQEEKIIRVIDGQLNSRAHDCLTTHGIAFFNELVFDTYVNEEKLDKQLWQSENWTFRETSKWSAEYQMIITNEMIER